MSSMQQEYVAQKYGAQTVSNETLENDLQFWSYIEAEIQKKIKFTENELTERLKLQDSRKAEQDQLAEKLNHYQANGLKKSDAECEPIVERLDMLSQCLKLHGIETSLQNELSELRDSLENARTHLKRLRFKQKLAAETGPKRGKER